MALIVDGVVFADLLDPVDRLGGRLADLFKVAGRYPFSAHQFAAHANRGHAGLKPAADIIFAGFNAAGRDNIGPRHRRPHRFDKTGPADMRSREDF